MKKKLLLINNSSSSRPSLVLCFNDALKEMEENDRKLAASYYHGGGYWDGFYDDYDEDTMGEMMGFDGFRNGELNDAYQTRRERLLKDFGFSSVKKGKTKGTLRTITHPATSSKRGCRGGSNKKNKYGNNSNLENTDSYLFDDYKNIMFYNDYEDNGKKKTFYSLKDFDLFLESEGIHVDKATYNKLIAESVLHCSINPRDYYCNGEKNLIASSSYSFLYNRCSQLEYGDYHSSYDDEDDYLYD